MRLKINRLAAGAIAALVGAALAGCQSSDLPMSPNGPQNQFFSTSNALLRVVDGSPNAGSACTVGGRATTCVDVSVDGSVVAIGVPYATISPLDAFAILPYISVPSGKALIQIFAAGTTNLVFEGAVSVSANKKYSFVLAGQAPVAPPSPFFQGYLFTDGTFLSPPGAVMATFHNASPNEGSLQFGVTCTACGAGVQNIGSSTGAGGSTVGPASLAPSGGYALQATNGTTVRALTPSALESTDTTNALPDPKAKQNVSIYAVDTAGAGAASYQLIGVFDSNG